MFIEDGMEYYQFSSSDITRRNLNMSYDDDILENVTLRWCAIINYSRQNTR